EEGTGLGELAKLRNHWEAQLQHLFSDVLTMGCRQRIRKHHDGVQAVSGDRRQGSIDVGVPLYLDGLEGDFERNGCRLCISALARFPLISGVPQYRYSSRPRHRLLQDLQPFAAHLGCKNAHTGDISARSRETRDEAGADWIC